MYDDPSFIRDKHVRVYLNQHEKQEIEAAARDSGRERASFMRDAALVVSRFIRLRKSDHTQPDLMYQIQIRLAARQAANDDDIRFSLAV